MAQDVFIGRSTGTKLVAGAIGRRRLGAGAELGLRSSVMRVLAAISGGAGAPASLLSPLAEGADQLIAAAALDAGWRLGAVLPFEPAAYAATFDLPDAARSRAEFDRLAATAAPPRGWGVMVLAGDPSDGGRDRAFLDCASWIIERADILLAVLDADDLASQTAHSVLQALDAGLPVARFDPAAPWALELRVGGESLAGPEALLRLVEWAAGIQTRL